ncbi:MAG: flagellar cap protein FliD N-terminal domain-containing protein, partial [Planctomycetota bacterium]
MGGISSNVGLASGIDTSSLISQLLAIEARPRVLAEQRVLQLQQQQGAWLSINSALSGLRSSAGAFRSGNLFSQSVATSSSPEGLTASATSAATPGAYTFRVGRLVTTEQRLSRGFGDTDTAGVGATSFTFESTAAELVTRTLLSELNGGEGVERGSIRVTDKSGASAEIDLSQVVEVNDVLDAINSNTAVGVVAEVDGDGLVIRDISGGTGTLTIEDTFGSQTATSLGIAGSASGASTQIVGDDIRTIDAETDLAILNDGLGVRIQDGSTDFTITASDGTELNINLGRITETEPDDGDPETEEETTVIRSRATTLQDVIDIINETAANADGGAGVNVSASIAGDGKSLVINDNTGGGGNLIIASASGRSTAEDLGIATGSLGTSASSFEGGRLVASINSVLTRTLNGGEGLATGEFDFTDRSGATTSITVSDAALAGSLTDVLEELNTGLAGAGVGLTVGINRAGNGLALTDTSGGNGGITVAGKGAEAVGLAVAGVGANSFEGASAQKQWIGEATRLEDLNDGEGVGLGDIRITDAQGDTRTVTIGDTIETVADLIAFLNSRPELDINASLNENGDGIQITDTSGGGGNLIIEDVVGNVAEALNLEGEFEREGGVLRADGSYERTVEVDE